MGRFVLVLWLIQWVQLALSALLFVHGMTDPSADAFVFHWAVCLLAFGGTLLCMSKEKLADNEMAYSLLLIANFFALLNVAFYQIAAKPDGPDLLVGLSMTVISVTLYYPTAVFFYWIGPPGRLGLSRIADSLEDIDPYKKRPTILNPHYRGPRVPDEE